MFYNNQHPYPEQPYYFQNQEERYQEGQTENPYQEQEPPYLAQQYPESQYQHNLYVAQHPQEPQYQHNPYVSQQTQEPQRQQNQHVSQQTQEPQRQQNQHVSQQTQEPQYQPNQYVSQQTQEPQYQPNQYIAQQTQEPQRQQNQHVSQQTQEPQYQQNPYIAQQYQYQQPQMYQPYHDPRVSPPAPTLDPTQPQILPPAPFDPTQIQILPPGPATQIPTEPTQQQIQQVVGTQFLPLKKPVLDFVKPWVEYGMNEAKYTSHKHALTEVAAIMFLVGKGFNPTIAHYIVESWEKNEQF
ncbi:hypothetical protein [Bacillus gaemokensis]|uniref:Group-specific protein n=1 Tax=Bacillus gaemokensis TaxID=574375 RepID=A0A073KCT6_9BACI|nr:hypothetical protein [Bacillus gaemokensis]KEK25059.1 hypothetical protein BAGA_18390 [Bacillus gaemokensis]KYG32554.1 hypothetical protein AZF08_10615 [Bacillus gaemokensis]